MARPLRIQYPGAFYHVMNRGARRDSIFLDPAGDRRLFLKTVADAVSLWKIRIHAFALMGNHYHLLIETPLGNLSRAMRHIDGIYTQRFNRGHDVDGPLFRGRFKAILIDRESYFLELLRYIHLNGVRAGTAARPEEDPFCSHRYYLQPRLAPPWLTTNFGLSLFGADLAQARSEFDVHVKRGVPSEVAEILDKPKWPALLGTEKFIDQVRSLGQIKETLPQPEKPEVRQLLLEKPAETNDVLNSVARTFSINLSDLLRSQKKPERRARRAAMVLLRQSCHLTYGQIGAIMGGVCDSAVGDSIQKALNDQDPLLEQLLRGVKGG